MHRPGHRERRGIELGRGVDRRARERHHEPRRHPVAARVPHGQGDAAIGERQEVVVVAPDLVGRAVAVGDRPARDRHLPGGQQLALDAARHLELVAHQHPVDELHRQEADEGDDAHEAPESGGVPHEGRAVDSSHAVSVVAHREEPGEQRDREEEAARRREPEGKAEEDDPDPVEETDDLPLRLRPLVLIAREHGVGLRHLPGEELPDVLLAQPRGVVADELLEPLEPPRPVAPSPVPRAHLFIRYADQRRRFAGEERR
ncbi:MAG: hypothetical protein BWX64_02696 [Acidobacteria bacterium ADurb.Bin051]|nr:MAG: hypothetical protein BWX64_02696 [Acidobacteria bacterium ADurb.Bin051]